MVEWRACPGFPAYQVSEDGYVRRVVRSKGAVLGAVLKGCLRPSGYRAFQLFYGRGLGKFVFSHRLVCEAWHGSPPSSQHQVAHSDGNPANNHYSNLRWATPSENERDKILHGTDNRGEKHPLSKLTADDVRQIRSKYVGRWGQAEELGKRYGVSKGCIELIATGRTWGHLDDYRKRRAAALKGLGRNLSDHPGLRA